MSSFDQFHEQDFFIMYASLYSHCCGFITNELKLKALSVDSIYHMNDPDNVTCCIVP